MARIREFDPEVALDKAMHVFWQKGYGNTSVEDLVSATGVNRHGLYGEFESKRGLFLAALDRYQSVVTWRAFAEIEKPGAGLAEVLGFLKMLVDISCSRMGRSGCLMANSAVEVAPYDRRTANKVEKFRDRLKAGFMAALRNARQRGEVNSRFDESAGADFLVGVMQGISVLARSGASQAMLSNVAATSANCLK